ncbi:hypothetical protein GCM10023169_14660 [Georgenia halophila]|uniref:Polysaccharide pyruvyl transferase domain-containing protein n=1 Tax=Georgenia halophila TaxID=620889 RepID=A0ABP8L2R5_9MICO
MVSNDQPRVLLVGAYERDNFGDLLFLLQSEEYLRNAEVTAAAPFPGDMTELLDRRIPAYGPLLEEQEYDCLWTVGGEVGATSFLGAYRMSMPPGVVRAYEAASPQVREEMIRRTCGNTPIENPYIPRPTAYPRNASAAMVLNSVGFAGITGLPTDQQEARLATIREADRIAVRDQLSADLLTAHGVSHTLAPDLVHSMALTRPRERPAEPDVALVQVSDAHLRQTGHEAFAEALARSAHLAPFRIRLFLAGTARGHDSVESYERIIAHVHRISPGRDIDISTARRPLDLADEIARAALWIGLSLHGRIVAAAYGVPRMSLAKRKLDAYAQTWDPEMPYGVTTEGLDDAVAEALSPAVAARAGTVGADLARMADRSVRATVTETLGEDAAAPAVRDARVRRRVTSLETWRQSQRSRLQSQVAERDRTIEDLRRRLALAETIASTRSPGATDRVLDGMLRRARSAKDRLPSRRA